MKGRVTKFFHEKGYGFIKDENGDNRFFHITNIKGYEDITQGSTVRFEPGVSTKGLVATQVILINKRKTDFVSLGNTKIRLNNIKNYGIDYITEVEVTTETKDYTTGEKIFNRTIGTVAVIVGILERTGGADLATQGIRSFGNSYTTETKNNVQYKVLYITTYQGDNFRFHEKYVDFDIDDKYNELNDYLCG